MTFQPDIPAFPALGAAYTSVSPFALAAIVAGAAFLAERHYRALPAVIPFAPTPTSSPASEPTHSIPTFWPRVSIVVPTRDEERNLPPLLDSLLALDYPDFEVLLVDDASTDATPSIAADYAARSGGRLRVLTGAGPQPGWTGKNFACWTGAQAADGDWLLFTDADTVHAPVSLRAAIATALASGASALSLFTAQRCIGFWERLLLPFAYQQYFVGVRPRSLTRPTGPALANGQYFLISHPAYDASGGHAAVASSIIDDVALASALKRAGYPPRACRGEALVSVHMYDSLPALTQGFTKNAAQFLQEQKAAGLLVVLSTAGAAGTLPILATGFLNRNLAAIAGALLAYAAQTAGILPWLRGFGVPRRYAFLAPFAALGFTLIALSSAWHTLARRPVRWKGRGYLPTASPATANPASPVPPQGEQTLRR